MFVLISLAFALLFLYVLAKAKDHFSVKAVPAYAPKSRIPRVKPRQLNKYFPPYYF